MDALNITLDNYNNIPSKGIIISYGIRKGLADSTLIIKEEVTQHHLYYNHKLPITANAEDYGNIITSYGNIIVTGLKKNITLVIETDTDSNHGKTNKIKYFKNGSLMYDWIDYIKEDGSIIREIGKTTILWKDGEIIWIKKLKMSKPITKKDNLSHLAKDFLTMDIETQVSLMEKSNLGTHRI